MKQNKHCSVSHDKHNHVSVTIWRGDDIIHVYSQITQSSKSRITLLTWQHAIDVSVHMSEVDMSFWFDYPQDDREEIIQCLQ